MPWKEWSLIINSLMVQLAAGILIFLALFGAVAGDGPAALWISAHGLALVGPVILIGMIASLFHLGHPLRAYRSVVNLRTSWLSREILFTALFLLLWVVCYAMARAGSPSVVMTWAAVAAGLLSVVSMAGIYTATGIQGWHGGNTFLGFFGTVVVLGSTGGAFIVLTAGHTESANGMILTSLLAALLMLTIRFACQLRLLRTMSATGEQQNLNRLVAAQATGSVMRPVVSLYKTLTLWAGTFSLAGIGLTLCLLWADRGPALPLALLAFGLLLAGELLGRAAFYSLWREPAQWGPGDRPERDVYGRYLRARA